MTEEQLKELVYINEETGMQFCADSREVYMEMLEIYLEQGEEYMKKLPALVEQKDWKNYIITVHGLKGTSLTIGAEAFSEKAKEQEFAGKGEQYEFIENGLSDFLALYEKMLEAVKALVDSEK
ncbi:MAG: Hpt domain-containing protein [Lachnospiraceae bacterium]|nr:Hpt domain-containing protein [Lachnospiraceae bacterium]